MVLSSLLRCSGELLRACSVYDWAVVSLCAKMLLQSALSALCLCLGIASAKSHPTVYMIRHGEKPQNPNDHGLTPDGVKRAQCLRRVFGQGSEYGIGHIMAPRVEWGRFTTRLESKPTTVPKRDAREIELHRNG